MAGSIALVSSFLLCMRMRMMGRRANVLRGISPSSGPFPCPEGKRREQLVRGSSRRSSGAKSRCRVEGGEDEEKEESLCPSLGDSSSSSSSSSCCFLSLVRVWVQSCAYKPTTSTAEYPPFFFFFSFSVWFHIFLLSSLLRLFLLSFFLRRVSSSFYVR